MNRLLVLSSALVATAAASADVGKDGYAPYEFLIGDWTSNTGGTVLRQSFSWGPNRSYIRYSTYLKSSTAPEKMHFDGIMVWNGKSKLLDFVFAIEPGSGIQEKGTVSAQPDGSLIREVELTGKHGSVSHFRQTFRSTGPKAAVTSVMRRTEAGWEPNFPGADRIEMLRSTAGN